MSNIVSCSTGEFIREQTTQEEQVYKALYKWSERLNKWEYSNQIKKNKRKKLKTFSPNAFSLMLIKNMNKMTNQEFTPEEAMSILYTTEGQTELRLCMEAGF